MARIEPELMVDARAEVGESPVWDDREQQLYWVDILAGDVHVTRPSTGADAVVHVGQPVGAVALRERGGLALALRDGVAVVEPGDTEPRLIARLPERPGIRMNDAKVDPAGRLWCETMAMDGAAGRGALLRLDYRSEFDVVLDGLAIPNGIDWSPDGTTMYFAESAERAVRAFPFDVETGALGPARLIIELDDDDGLPDGLTVDSEGCIWLAIWGGWGVRRYAPDGGLIDRLNLPVEQVTCPAFGGPGLDELFLTTAHEDFAAGSMPGQPTAGGLFRLRPGVTGRVANRFAG